MKTNNEIKKMSAVELLNTFAKDGEQTVESVGVHQNFETETTTLLFEDCAIEISGGFIDVVEYYTPSENVSHVCERATRNMFRKWFLECTDWYDSYRQDSESDDYEFKTIDEYADWLCETELTEWDGDEAYELNI